MVSRNSDTYQIFVNYCFVFVLPLIFEKMQGILEGTNERHDGLIIVDTGYHKAWSLPIHLYNHLQPGSKFLIDENIP